MTIALIIVNYNSGRLLARCLSSVHQQTRPPDRIIIVDNASTDESLMYVRSDPADTEVIRLDRNIGFAAANNRALEICAGYDWVALLNPDAFPEPGWLEQMERACGELPDAGSFASCLVSADDPSILDGKGDAYHVSGLVWRAGHGDARPEHQARREVFSACAAAAVYRFEALVAAGGFDNDYFCYNEDVDLGFRLRLLGRRCWYIPEAVAHHVGSATTGRHSDFSLYYGHRNLVWTWVKNMPSPLLCRFLWQHLLLNLVTIVVLSVRHRSTAPIRAKISALAGLKRVLGQRRAIQQNRTCADDDLSSAMTHGWWRCYFQRGFSD